MQRTQFPVNNTKVLFMFRKKTQLFELTGARFWLHIIGSSNGCYIINSSCPSSRSDQNEANCIVAHTEITDVDSRDQISVRLVQKRRILDRGKFFLDTLCVGAI